MKSKRELGRFDVVYLDGVHDFLHDALACCLLKMLLKPQGYIIFDDVQWAWEYYVKEVDDVEGRKWALSHYTDSQIKDFQVGRTLQIFMDDDDTFQRLPLPSVRRAMYQKIR